MKESKQWKRDVKEDSGEGKVRSKVKKGREEMKNNAEEKGRKKAWGRKQ